MGFSFVSMKSNFLYFWHLLAFEICCSTCHICLILNPYIQTHVHNFLRRMTSLEPLWGLDLWVLNPAGPHMKKSLNSFQGFFIHVIR